MIAAGRLAGVATREEKKAETRRRLLDAAVAVFAKKGYDGTSLDDVAKAAGLTKGAVYSNFESKDDLFQTLLDERMDRPMNAIAANYPEPGADLGEQVEEATRQYLDVLDRNRELWLLGNEFFLRAARNPEFRERFGQRHYSHMEQAAKSIEAGAASQGFELPVPARHLAVLATALFDGLSQQRITHPDSVPNELYALGMELIFEALAARATAPKT